MARVHPDGWRALKPSGIAAREIETLERLAARLSDSYTLFHGVHWSRLRDGQTFEGDIDFALVNPAGDILLIEQIPGLLEETDEGLVKRRPNRPLHVASRLAHAAGDIAARLRPLCPDNTPTVSTLLYCPDYQVRSPGSAGLTPARIVDAGSRDQLIDRIRQLLPEAAVTPAAAKVRRFLADELELVPDIDAAVDESRMIYTRLAGGLAHWGRRIECQPFRLRVIGTAGSGKTQLALDVLEDAVAADRRPLYVCYNRPLADHISQLAPARAEVATYHQLADRLYRATGTTPDFGRPDAFRRLEAFVDAYQPDPASLFDDLIVDEGQDFQPAWRDNLLRLLRPEGRAWWLEDPMQNLYDRPAIDATGWVTLRADTNYRTPRDVVAWLNGLLDPDHAIAAGSPFSGDAVDILTYADDAELFDRTKTAITRGLGAGFRKENLILLTYRGREHSRFTPLTRLGPHTLRAFANRYDLFGNPLHSEGDLEVDSVYRFKGRSAPCVIFTEIDFETLDERALRKLFVGMTRASMKAILVVSERSASLLTARHPT